MNPVGATAVIQVNQSYQPEFGAPSAIKSAALETLKETPGFEEFVGRQKVLSSLIHTANPADDHANLIFLMATAGLHNKMELQGQSMERPSERLQQQIIEKIKSNIGFDVNSRVGDDHDAVLKWSTHFGLDTLTEYLINRPDIEIDAANDGGRTAFTNLVVGDNIRMVNIFLEKGADPCRSDGEGQNSLMKAISCRKYLNAEAILTHAIESSALKEKPLEKYNNSTRYEEVVCATNRRGWSPLSYLAQKWDPRIGAMFFGDTAAVQSNLSKEIKEFIAGKQNVIVRMLGQCDNDGCNPLMVGSRHGTIDSVKAILNFLKEKVPEATIKEIIDQRDYWGSKNPKSSENKGEWLQDGNTAISEAARYGKTEVVQLLLDAGADPWRENGFVHKSKPYTHKCAVTVAEELAHKNPRIWELLRKIPKPSTSSSDPSIKAERI